MLPLGISFRYTELILLFEGLPKLAKIYLKHYQPISDQYSNSIPPENVIKPAIF